MVPFMYPEGGGPYVNIGPKSCSSCDVVFAISVRRHRCRKCNRRFCNQCSANRMLLAGSTRHQRVCTRCFEDGNNTKSVELALLLHVMREVGEPSEKLPGISDKCEGDQPFQ